MKLGTFSNAEKKLHRLNNRREGAMSQSSTKRRRFADIYTVAMGVLADMRALAKIDAHDPKRTSAI